MSPPEAILLVEDNKDDEELTIRAFKKHGIASELVVARDGAEAVDYLFGSGRYLGRDVNDLPKLVLLDLNLPKLNGIDVLRRIRADERTKTLSVVMFTSSDEEKDIVESYSAGADSYVRKPVDFVHFAEAMKIIALFWLGLNRRPTGEAARTLSR